MSDARGMPAAAAAAFLGGTDKPDDSDADEQRDSDGTPVGAADAEEDRLRAARESTAGE